MTSEEMNRYLSGEWYGKKMDLTGAFNDRYGKLMDEYGRDAEDKLYSLCEQPVNHFQGLTPAHMQHIPALAEKLKQELLKPVRKSLSAYRYDFEEPDTAEKKMRETAYRLK